MCVYSIPTKSRGNFNGFSFMDSLLGRFITNTTCNGICCLRPPARINQVQWSQNKSKMSTQLLLHILCTVKKNLYDKNKSIKKVLGDYSFVETSHYRPLYILFVGLSLISFLTFKWDPALSSLFNSTPTKQSAIYELWTTKTDVYMSFLWSRLELFWCESFRANC